MTRPYVAAYACIPRAELAGSSLAGNGPGWPACSRARNTAQRLRGEAVQRRGGAVAVPDTQQEQAARPEGGAETIEDQRGVRNPVEQEAAVHDIGRPGREQRGRQVAQNHRAAADPAWAVTLAASAAPRVPRRRGRAVCFVHRGHADLVSAGSQLSPGRVPDRRLPSGPQHGRGPARAPGTGSGARARRTGPSPAGRAVPHPRPSGGPCGRRAGPDDRLLGVPGGIGGIGGRGRPRRHRVARIPAGAPVSRGGVAPGGR